MKPTHIAIAAGSLILVLLIVLVIVLSTKKPVDKATADESIIENSETDDNSGRPNRNSAKTSDEKKDSESNDPVAEPTTPLPVDTSLIHGDLSQIQPSSWHRYKFQLEVKTESEKPRAWQGEFKVRTESPWSDTTIRRKTTNPSQPSKEYQVVSKQYGTGLLIPRRWILVGNHFVEGATEVSVKIDGKWQIAKVHSRLKKTGIAVLQMKSGSFPKVPIPREGKLDRELNFAWLNALGELEILRDVRYSGYSSGAGGSYRFRQNVTDDCVGGITFDGNGNITGLVVDATHPLFDKESRCSVHPMTRVAKCWNEKNQAIIFDFPRTAPIKNMEGELKSRMVQVLVERPASDETKIPVFIHSDINAPQTASGRVVGFYSPSASIRSRSSYNVSANPYRIEGRGLLAKQVPFFMGKLPDLVLFAYGSLQTSIPVKVNRFGFDYCDTEKANGEFKITDLKLSRNSESIIGQRTLQLFANPGPEPGRRVPVDVDLNCKHDFVIRLGDNMPTKSTVTGTVKIGTRSGPKVFTIEMNLGRIE